MEMIQATQEIPSHFWECTAAAFHQIVTENQKTHQNLKAQKAEPSCKLTPESKITKDFTASKLRYKHIPKHILALTINFSSTRHTHSPTQSQTSPAQTL